VSSGLRLEPVRPNSSENIVDRSNVRILIAEDNIMNQVRLPWLPYFKY
jgi:hypothetical protein